MLLVQAQINLVLKASYNKVIIESFFNNKTSCFVLLPLLLLVVLLWCICRTILQSSKRTCFSRGMVLNILKLKNFPELEKMILESRSNYFFINDTDS